MSMFKRSLRWTLNTFLSRAQRRKFGAFVLNEASGNNDGDAATNGEYALLQRMIEAPAPAPRIVFDVGANIGDWSREFLRRAGKEDRVFAFEPSKATFDRLRTTLGDARATLVNMALSDRDGEGVLHVAGELSGTNSIHRREFKDSVTESAILPPASESIRLQTGDGYCVQHGITRINFMKIDTEGHELSVLKGFNTMLSDQRIDALQFEYGGTWLDSRVQLTDAFALLIPKGYLIAKIFPAGLKYCAGYDQSLDTFQYANFAALLPAMKSRFSEIK